MLLLIHPNYGKSRSPPTRTPYYFSRGGASAADRSLKGTFTEETRTGICQINCLLYVLCTDRDMEGLIEFKDQSAWKELLVLYICRFIFVWIFSRSKQATHVLCSMCIISFDIIDIKDCIRLHSLSYHIILLFEC